MLDNRFNGWLASNFLPTKSAADSKTAELILSGLNVDCCGITPFID